MVLENRYPTFSLSSAHPYFCAINCVCIIVYTISLFMTLLFTHTVKFHNSAKKSFITSVVRVTFCEAVNRSEHGQCRPVKKTAE